MQANEVISIRKALNLTQEAFGDMIGKSRRAVQSWENGTRSIPRSAEIQIRSLSDYDSTQNTKSSFDANKILELIDQMDGPLDSKNELRDEILKLIKLNEKLQNKIGVMKDILR